MVHGPCLEARPKYTTLLVLWSLANQRRREGYTGDVICLATLLTQAAAATARAEAAAAQQMVKGLTKAAAEARTMLAKASADAAEAKTEAVANHSVMIASTY
jgi:hypothetical protein